MLEDFFLRYDEYLRIRKEDYFMSLCNVSTSVTQRVSKRNRKSSKRSFVFRPVVGQNTQ
jgi:hypothetical protein